MEKKKTLVDRQIIVDLLFGDEEYVSQFIEASLESFTEFKNNYQQAMRIRDLEHLKKTGHKIKPVAQMMHLDPILGMYEKSKLLIEEDASDREITELMQKMREFCDELLAELKDLK